MPTTNSVTRAGDPPWLFTNRFIMLTIKCLPGEWRRRCVKIHRREGVLAPRPALGRTRALRLRSRPPAAAGAPGSGPGRSPHLQESLCSSLLGPPQPRRLFGTPSCTALATVTRETSNAARGTSSCLYGGREGPGSSESDSGADGPGRGGREIGAAG